MATTSVEWRFNVIETIGFACSMATLAVGITLWSMNTFETKENAKEVKRQTDSRLDRQGDAIRAMGEKIDKIGGNVEWIRGRLEPKQ